MAKVLLVDDEKDLVKVVGMRLQQAGHDVIAAYDGQEGIDKAKSNLPDVILMDVMMPEIDGVNAANILGEDIKTKNIPIIFFTALRSKKHEKHSGSQIGNSTVLAKPLDNQELLDEIDKRINWGKTNES